MRVIPMVIGLRSDDPQEEPMSTSESHFAQPIIEREMEEPVYG